MGLGVPALQVSAVQSECDHRAHLLVECGDLSASFGADNKGPLSGAVHLWRLEAVEQLPAMSSDMASSAARLHEVLPAYASGQDLCTLSTTSLATVCMFAA